MEKPILYSINYSPPVRAVKMIAAALGVELELRNVNLLTGEHMQEWFLELNPQHTVPVLDDNGKVVWDSHAIAGYLVNTYGKDDSLYPKDPYKRARVDQRLHFDTGILYPCLRDINVAILFGGLVDVPEDKIEGLYEACDILEIFLKDDPYLAGDALTVADLCLVPTVTSMVYHAPIDPEMYPKITAWIERLAQLPYYEINANAILEFEAFLDKKKRG